ncbi:MULTISPECIES: phage tail protein [Asaia]|uniref:phage tail protein n=1 Tax=Asaia TaxID=91914 RepID=UPI002FC2B899
MAINLISGGLAWGESRLPVGGVAIAEAINAFLGGNNSANAPVMLMLGNFKFSLNTAPFSEITRNTAASWGTVPRFGQYDAMQFTGPGPDTVELPGVIYSEKFGFPASIDQLRSMMMAGKPARLILGDGSIVGAWVITGIRETKTNFNSAGSARRIEFSVSLTKYADI